MEYKNGEEFLNKLYSNMHMSEVVMHTAERRNTPEEKIEKYMQRLKKVHNIAKTKEHKMNILKEFYYNKYIIKEISDNYIKLQQKIAREQGYGNIEVTDNMKQEMLKNIQSDQKKSLDIWIDYLTSDDADYPMWFKNYAFTGMLKLGKFDKEEGKFQKRTKTTTEPYLDLNREILSYIYNTLSHEIGENKLTDEDIEAINHGESFQKMYLYYIKKMGAYQHNSETEGKWIKYEQGEDYKKLWLSLQGKNTGWCTAGEETCKNQLKNGDFHVYYTKDKEGNYTEPRIAIRMNGQNEIAEVRGIEKEQNIENNMIEIVEKKLNEFPNKDSYKKKVHDMKLLTEIESKTKSNITLTKEELKFLYEIDGKIDGFGYEIDPRINEIKEMRNHKKDIANIFNCSENQIGTNVEDFKGENDIICYLDNLDLSSYRSLPKEYSHLKIILGNADFKSLEDTRGLNNLQYIGGNAYFSSLKDAGGLNNLQYIGGMAGFSLLEDARELNNLKYIGKTAGFDSLENSTGLNNLKEIGWDAQFKSLKDARGLSNLQTIKGSAHFESLKDATGLNKLQTINWNAHFDSLENSTGLNSLKEIGWNAQFKSLKDARGLSNLQTINGSAIFPSLEDATALSKPGIISEKHI